LRIFWEAVQLGVLCAEANIEMYEKITIGFIGAILALFIKELYERYKHRAHRKKVAELCVNHLQQIYKDLTDHVQIGNGNSFNVIPQ
jgi:hypothetical protein